MFEPRLAARLGIAAVAFGASTLGLSINAGAEQLFGNPSLAANAKSPMNWATFSFDWVADTASTSLSFLGRANGNLSNHGVIGLDNVVAEQVGAAAVPEPGSWALLAAGLGALALSARRPAARVMARR